MKDLDLLKKVRRVEAPPFLLTRIQAKIGAAETGRLPVSWRWAGGLTFGLLLFFNVFSLKFEKTTLPSPAGQIAESLHLQTSNQLYDE